MDELPPKPIVPMMPPVGSVYAGFWRRFNAYGIDATIIWLACVLLQWLIIPDAPPAAVPQSGDDIQQLQELLSAAQSGQVSPALMAQVKDSLFNSSLGGSVLGADTTLMVVLSAIYNIWFAASEWQATPGKRWLKMKIMMLDGSRLTLQQSAFRHLATAVSAVAWMIPTVTVAFTRDKLAPHDMMVGTRVVHFTR